MMDSLDVTDTHPLEDPLVRAHYHAQAARLGQQLQREMPDLEEEIDHIKEMDLPLEDTVRLSAKATLTHSLRQGTPRQWKEMVLSEISELVPHLPEETLRKEAFEYFLEEGASALHPNRYSQVQQFIREEAERSGRSQGEVWRSESLAALTQLDLTEFLQEPAADGKAWRTLGDRLGEAFHRRTSDASPPVSLEGMGEQWTSDSPEESDPEASPYYEDDRVPRSEQIRDRLEAVHALLQHYDTGSLKYEVLQVLLSTEPGPENGNDGPLVHADSSTVNVSAVARRVEGVSRYHVEQALEGIQRDLTKRF